MDVKGRGGFPGCDHLMHAGDRFEQGVQSRGAADDDPAAAPRHKRGVTDKLDCVAITLFSMQENAATFEVRSLPPGLFKVRSRRREVA
jgi:hypothetical protein